MRQKSIIVEPASRGYSSDHTWSDALNLESVGKVNQLALGVGVIELDGRAADRRSAWDTEATGGSGAAASAAAAEPAQAAASAAFGHEVRKRVAEVPSAAAVEAARPDEGLAEVDIPAVTDAALAHSELIQINYVVKGTAFALK